MIRAVLTTSGNCWATIGQPFGNPSLTPDVKRLLKAPIPVAIGLGDWLGPECLLRPGVILGPRPALPVGEPSPDVRRRRWERLDSTPFLNMK